MRFRRVVRRSVLMGFEGVTVTRLERFEEIIHNVILSVNCYRKKTKESCVNIANA